MKFIYSVCIFLIFYIYACTTTYSLKNGDFSNNQINDKLEEKQVTAVMKDGKEHKVTDIQVSDRQIYYKDLDSNKTNLIPISDVRQIIDVKHGKGALTGLGVGFLSGFTLGAVIGIAATDPDHKTSGFVDVTPKNYFEGALGYGLGFAIPFAIIGLPVGAIAGDKDIYLINEQPGSLHAPKYVTIKVNTIVEKHNNYIVVQKTGSNIRIEREHLKNIKNEGDEIYITLTAEEYNKKFK